jgi:beta-glucosidase
VSTRRQFLGGIAATAGTVAWGSGCSDVETPPTDARAPDFFWGVGVENTWMVQADPDKDGTRRPLDEFELTQHYQRWPQDLELAASLGVTAMRYSIPWPRAETAPGNTDFGWLEGPIAKLRELGIVPILDLLHYGTPAWLKDGIGEPAFPDAFAAYASAIAQHFRGQVDHFTPHNEPQVGTLLSGVFGFWPPYGNTPARWVELGMHTAGAMVLATRALRDANPEAVVISADAIDWTLAARVFPQVLDTLPESEQEDLRAVVGSFPASLAYGKVPVEHRFGQRLIEAGAKERDLEWLLSHAEVPDILGSNHYPDIVDFAAEGDFTRGGSLPLIEAAAEAAARVEQSLRRAHAAFDRPVYLSETSAGSAPTARAAYATALGEMRQRLRAEGFPLVGINWWPLFLAARWEYREHPDAPLTDYLLPGGWNNGLWDLVPQSDGGLLRVETDAVAAFRAAVKR